MIRHYDNCSAKYPEKPRGEKAQHIFEIDLGDGEKVRQCSDCGAHEVVRSTRRVTGLDEIHS